MRITEQTRYALRILAACARCYPERAKVTDLSTATGITEFNIFKLLKVLTRAGLVRSTRGRGGGIRLSVPPAAVSVGQVVRLIEPRFQVCGPAGRMQGDPAAADPTERAIAQVIGRGFAAFLAELDQVPLADLVLAAAG